MNQIKNMLNKEPVDLFDEDLDFEQNAISDIEIVDIDNDDEETADQLIENKDEEENYSLRIQFG